jgi:peptidoglycan-associated lipoprotein
MDKQRVKMRSSAAILLALTLALMVAGCKKKAPAPAPPPPSPPPKVETKPEPPPAPRINSFTVEPASIERGQSATLRWTVVNATDISIDQGIGSVGGSGNRQVFPSNTVTYTLTARGAGGQDSRTATVEVTSAPPPPAPKPKPPSISGVDILRSETQDALFDYDKFDIRDDARQVLTRNADVLKRIFAGDPSFTVVVEGHCDERGSSEYNMGLGDRRATSARDFLVQLGVSADRLKTISYGKERPLCTDANEDCYQRNRRAHLSPGN